MSIVQAVVCHPPSCRLDEIRRQMLFAQKIRLNPRMMWSPLMCCIRIIRSSALVQASSSLSMVRTRAWPRTSSSTSSILAMVFAGLSLLRVFIPSFFEFVSPDPVCSFSTWDSTLCLPVCSSPPFPLIPLPRCLESSRAAISISFKFDISCSS